MNERGPFWPVHSKGPLACPRTHPAPPPPMVDAHQSRALRPRQRSRPASHSILEMPLESPSWKESQRMLFKQQRGIVTQPFTFGGGFWPRPQHVEVPWAGDQPHTIAETRATMGQCQIPKLLHHKRPPSHLYSCGSFRPGGSDLPSTQEPSCSSLSSDPTSLPNNCPTPHPSSPCTALIMFIKEHHF